MIIFIQLIAVFINLLILVRTVGQLKNKLKMLDIVLLLFQIIFVIPIVFEWIFDIQDYSYKSPGFHAALNDSTTNILYSLFTILVSLLLYFYSKKETITNNSYDIKKSLMNLKINRKIYLLAVILMFLPSILIIFSPSPEKYLTQYAYFQRYPDVATSSELWFHKELLGNAGYVSLVSILITKTFSKNTFFNNFLIYSAAITTGILNGKRTLFTLIIFAILSVDILKTPKGKFPYKKIIINILLIILVFVAYAFIIDKHTRNVSTIDNLRLYFFRDTDVKFAIYALLNPERYKILNYWGQSYIYNLFFYIPRKLWENKPYPFDIYVTASALGYPAETVLSWSFQTSFFGEAISNLGIFGIPFSIWFIGKIIKTSEKTENTLVIVLGLFVIMFSFMNHFGAYYKYLILWIVLVIFSKYRFKERNR